MKKNKSVCLSCLKNIPNLKYSKIYCYPCWKIKTAKPKKFCKCGKEISKVNKSGFCRVCYAEEKKKSKPIVYCTNCNTVLKSYYHNTNLCLPCFNVSKRSTKTLNLTKSVKNHNCSMAVESQIDKNIRKIVESEKFGDKTYLTNQGYLDNETIKNRGI